MLTPLVKQAWVASAVLINMMGQGMLLSYASCLLPALKDPQSPIFTDLHTASWVLSSIGISGVPGFFISSYLMELFGRRIAHLIVILPGTAGWLMIYLSTNISVIMIARILGGLTAGATVALGAIMIGEYCSPIYRGMFLNLKTTSVCFGGMIVHILTYYCNWQTVAFVAVFPYLFALVITYTWPESPSWYADRQRLEECREAFLWLRGNSEESNRELEELIQARIEINKGIKKDQNFLEKMQNFLQKFLRKDFVKPLFICVVGTVLLEASGRHIFPAFALVIISGMTGNNTNSFLYTLCIDVIVLIGSLFSSVLVRIMKRRTLLFSTGFASCLVIMIACAYLFLESRGIISKDYNFIPIILFVIFCFLVNLGCAPIPLALLGELFPLNHRPAGAAMTGIIMSLGVMVGLKLTPILMESVKVYGTFVVYGLIMAVALGILYFILPETKDKTLQEIEDYFNGKSHEKHDVDEEVKLKMLPA